MAQVVPKRDHTCAKAWLIILSQIFLPALHYESRFTLMRLINWNLTATQRVKPEREITLAIQICESVIQ